MVSCGRSCQASSVPEHTTTTLSAIPQPGATRDPTKLVNAAAAASSVDPDSLTAAAAVAHTARSVAERASEGNEGIELVHGRDERRWRLKKRFRLPIGKDTTTPSPSTNDHRIMDALSTMPRFPSVADRRHTASFSGHMRRSSIIAAGIPSPAERSATCRARPRDCVRQSSQILSAAGVSGRQRFREYQPICLRAWRNADILAVMFDASYRLNGRGANPGAWPHTRTHEDRQPRPVAADSRDLAGARREPTITASAALSAGGHLGHRRAKTRVAIWRLHGTTDRVANAGQWRPNWPRLIELHAGAAMQR